MSRISITLALCLIISSGFAQDNLINEIKRIQLQKLKDGVCLDFIRNSDMQEIEESGIQQILVFRHGEPALHKKGWKNRKEAIRYTEMYDSVGIYDFEQKPICLRENDIKIVYTSKLPRSINTAEKTFNQSLP